MVYTKSGHHGCALIDCELVTIEGITFIRGTQVTGKEWHRMERKRTLIQFEHVASIVEFQYEDDLWKEPQPKHIRLPEEERQYTPLTSHQQTEQPKPQGQGRPFQRGGHRGGHRNNRHRHRNNEGNRFPPHNTFTPPDQNS